MSEKLPRKHKGFRITLTKATWTQLPELPEDIACWRLLNLDDTDYLDVSFNDTTTVGRDEEYFQLYDTPRGSSEIKMYTHPKEIWVKRNTANQVIYFEYWLKEE